MKKVIFAVALVALASLAVAQDVKTVVPAAIGQKVIAPAIPGRGPIMSSDWVVKAAVPPFCKAKCLYYAGDFNSANPNANGLFNSNYSAAGLVGQTWPGVKPPAAATIHGATFNEFANGSTVTNPTPFQTEVKVVAGSGGKVVCNTSGSATMKVYGEADFGLTQYSIYIKKLKKACAIQAGKKGATYVNLLPTIASGSALGYTVNVEDSKPANHIGWKNDLDDCYFNGPAFGVTWQSCSTQGTFDELSFALNK